MGTRCLTDPVILHLWNEAAGRAATAFCGLWGRGGQARAPAPSPELPWAWRLPPALTPSGITFHSLCSASLASLQYQSHQADFPPQGVGPSWSLTQNSLPPYVKNSSFWSRLSWSPLSCPQTLHSPALAAASSQGFFTSLHVLLTEMTIFISVRVHICTSS